MSLDPALPRHTASGPAETELPASGGWAGPPITRVDVLPLLEGDRLIVHVDGAAGMSAGGAHEAGRYVRAALKLDELPFDVPVLIAAPGIRVTVARPG